MTSNDFLADLCPDLDDLRPQSIEDDVTTPSEDELSIESIELRRPPDVLFDREEL